MTTPIIYFSSQSTTYPEFSNFWAAPICVEGQTFKNAEEAFQGIKALTFHDHEAFTKIQKSKSPASAKSYGRKVKGFQESVWSAMKLDLMRNIVLAKFSQNPLLKEKLLATGDAVLAEATRDAFWGIGAGRKGALEGNQSVWGQNHLGTILMEVRAELASA